jgi:polyisoprenoid-binding protein YceI
MSLSYPPDAGRVKIHVHQAHPMSSPSAWRGSRLVVVGWVLWGLAACQTSPPAAPGPEAPVSAPQPAAGAVPAGAREYKVSAEESLLQILVYRGGAMSRFGHNHVIASHRVEGSVYVTDDPLATRFDVAFPVAELTVDEPALRAAAGPDFPPSVPQNARDGTRTNLLSTALLDATNYPEIRLRATDIRAAGENYDAGVEVLFKGQAYVFRVPVAVRRESGSVAASGEFPLRQSELGLKPFSVAMGSLVVLDEMHVRFEITARE